MAYMGSLTRFVSSNQPSNGSSVTGSPRPPFPGQAEPGREKAGMASATPGWHMPKYSPAVSFKSLKVAKTGCDQPRPPLHSVNFLRYYVRPYGAIVAFFNSGLETGGTPWVPFEAEEKFE